MALYRLLLRRLTARPRSPPPTPQAGSAMALYHDLRDPDMGPMLLAMASLLGHVEPAPKDPILGVTEAFLADPMAGRDPPRRVRPEVEEVAGGDVVVGGAVAGC
ncbi:hypothetical protein ZWY2020_048687 [Hordeum vulgare]|nr:hypothetical protein ZWY2020_048687 [Hordeum vulgare]